MSTPEIFIRCVGLIVLLSTIVALTDKVRWDP